MKMIKRIAVVLLLITLPSGVFADEEKPDVIQLDSGPIRGKVDDGVRIFSGIPYAAPPIAELRWKPPQELAAWTQVRECTLFGPACPQPKQQDGGKFSEDCLYLNVWSPAVKPDERLPVMVWIHGGAFNFGSGSQPDYHGKNLAKKGVVVVTINYRLGPLGFLVHPLLSKESARGTSGNYGLLDQIAALQWVQKNIAAFGGNPDRVTIFGQSAGSRSVTLLMISPLSAGLFHGAIAVSGGPIIGSEYLNPAFNGNLANVSNMGQKLTSKLGCEKAEDVLAAMRAKSAQEILDAADCRTSVFDYEGLFFAPVFDAWVLPKEPLAAYSSGQQHDVPIIVGSTRNEGNLYLADETDLSAARYQSFLKARFADDSGKAFEMFPAHEAKDVARAIDDFLTVAANAQPARFVAQSMEPKKSKAFLFQFTRRPDTAMARKLGVHHGVDIAYVFGNMNKSDGYEELDLGLSDNIMDYWVNFAKTGNPNGPGLAEWPAYASQSDLNLEFSDTIHTNKHLFKKECDFIDRQSTYRFELEHDPAFRMSSSGGAHQAAPAEEPCSRRRLRRREHGIGHLPADRISSACLRAFSKGSSVTSAASTSSSSPVSTK
jgi:para-nitrobenzyl esterase